MKKKNFLSRINAYLALAVVALTSAFFVGCSEEKLDINQGGGTTELPNPVCTITVTVLDMTTGENVTNPSLTASAGTISGNTITLTGESIPAQSITITAAAGDIYTKDGSVTVNVPALVKGQSLSMDATILMVQKGSDEGYVLAGVTQTTGEVKSSSKTYTDEKWVAGKEAIEKITLTVANAGTTGYEVKEAEDLTEIAQVIYDEMKKNKPSTYDIVFTDIAIPANHKASVEVITTETEITYTITESNGKSARQSTFTVIEYASSAFYTLISTGEGGTSSAAPVFTIEVEVKDDATGEVLDMSSVTVDPKKYTLKDGVIVITDAEKIEEQTVTITYPENANYFGGSKTVLVPELKKGSEGSTKVVIEVKKKSGASTTDWVIIGTPTFVYNLNEATAIVGTKTTGKKVFYTYGHNQYLQDTRIEYTKITGWKVAPEKRATLEEHQADFVKYLKVKETYKEEKAYTEYFAMYDFSQLEGDITTTIYGGTASLQLTNGTETQTLAVEIHSYATLANITLTAMPGHGHHGHSHGYNPDGTGHAGHGHNGSDNAGGGITWSAN